MMTENWIRIFSEIEEEVKDAQDSGELIWFRGHAYADWELRSGIHRHVDTILQSSGHLFSESEKKAALYEEYKTLYYKYVSEAWPLLNEKEKSDWGLIFSMQHYGLSTRLLDWTESFICSLYFAQQNRKRNDSAAIYILKPEKLNEAVFGQRGLVSLLAETAPSKIETLNWHPKFPQGSKDLPTIAVLPFFSNNRLIAQRGTFLLCGDSFEPLDEQFQSSDCIRKMILPPDTYDDASLFLKLTGYTHYSAFPDFQGLKMNFEQYRIETIEKLKMAKFD